MNERNSLGQTPLHLSAGWYRGFRLLLDAGADYDAGDNYGWVVLAYACSAECLETVQYLLEKQTTFVGHYFDYFGEESRRTAMELLRSVSNQQIVDLVLSAFVDRRKQLLQMARNFLADEQLDRLVPTNDHVLDVNVGDVHESLAARTSVPAYLDTQLADGETVFHLAGNNTSLATKFWDLGFRDVDGCDAYNRTALMEVFDMGPEHCVPSLKQTLWLATKGASIFRRIHHGGWLVSHYFANHLGRSLPSHRPEIPRDNIEGLVEQLRTEADLDTAMLIEDMCNCRCSISGCIAHTVFVHRLGFKWADRTFEAAEWWIKIFCALPQKPRCDILKQIFRAIIFDLLRLKHTCCQHSERWWDWSGKEEEDERHEIYAEQAESYALLETLIDLALSQWLNETRSFSEFMKEFFEIQIKAKEGPPTKEYVEQLEAIGVRVEGLEAVEE